MDIMTASDLITDAPRADAASTDPAQSRLVRFIRALIPGAVARSSKSSFKSARFWLLAVGHLIMFSLIYWTAYAVRFGFDVKPGDVHLYWASLPLLLAVKFVIFYASGHYHGWWRYVTFGDLVALLRASLFSFFALGTLDYFINTFHVPRGVWLLDAMLSILILGSMRASWRLAREQFRSIVGTHDCTNILVVGTDDPTALLAYQIQSHPECKLNVRGFLESNGSPVNGRRLGQIPVVGHVRDAATVAKDMGIRRIVMLSGALPGHKFRKLMKSCDANSIELKIIPRAEDLFTGGRHIPARDVEISDLLRRDPIQLDDQSIANLVEGRTVVVTGAGGSIGSEICRQVIRFKPSLLLLAGRGENRIFEIERELQQLDVDVCVQATIVDVTDEQRMRHLFETYHPEVIFHAAAHKHVPLMEANVGEAIKNNVGGTRCVADLAHEFEAHSFVLVSTDKAVHPTSVMGATKHMAERYVQALSQQSKTRFVVTRFGNVLGSNGSVVPIFQQQIRDGGPITVTDPEMTRFFMTIPEASQLVLQAAAMGKGGEIFVLEMGEPVRIVDLARDLIRLSGLPEDAIEIKFTGVRPGEKLYEELYFDDEATLPTQHPKLRSAFHRPFSWEEARAQVEDLLGYCYANNATARSRLRALIPEYLPSASRESVKATQDSIAHAVN